jgi:hypothetical protein
MNSSLFSKSCFLLLLLTLSSLKNSIFAQCSGCTTTYASSTSANITVGSGQVICVNSGVTLSGQVYLNGGTLCNNGTVNNLRLNSGRGRINNYGTIKDTESSISFAGNVSIYGYSTSQFTFTSASFNMGSIDSLYFNVGSSAKVIFSSDLNINSRKLSIYNAGIFNVGNDFNLNNAKLFFYNASGGIFNVSGSLNLVNEGNKTINNLGTINAYNDINVAGDGASVTTVLIDNQYNITTVSNLESTITNAIFTLKNAPSSSGISVGQDLVLSEASHTLINNGPLQITDVLDFNNGTITNSGLLTCGNDLTMAGGSLNNSGNMALTHDFVMQGGTAINSGTISSSSLSASGGTLTNNDYVQTSSNLLITGASAVLNNNKNIVVANTFSNTSTVILDRWSWIYTKHFFNGNSTAYINGPQFTYDTLTLINDTSQYAGIIVTDNSLNTGFLTGHTIFHDQTLTGTTGNNGYGFDTLANAARVGVGTLFGSISLGPVNPVAYNCRAIYSAYPILLSANPGIVCQNVTTPVLLSVGFFIGGNYNLPMMPPPGTTFLWQPGNLPGQTVLTNVVNPTGVVMFTVTINIMGCILPLEACVAKVKPSTLATDAGPDQLILPGASIGIGGSPSALFGNPPYGYSWSPNSFLTSNTIGNPTANPPTATTYVLTVTDSFGCTSIDDMTVYFQQISYAVLKKEIDAGFFDLTPARNPIYGSVLNFLFEEEYINNGVNLQYRILRMDRTLVSGIPTQSVAYKENRYSINLSSLGLSATNAFYILEATDKKGEKSYLRFKY